MQRWLFLRELARAEKLAEENKKLIIESGMNTLADIARSAVCENGFVIVRMESGAEIRFPVAENLRLARGTPRQLNHIEISPFGLHWPDLDEDLSFRGLLEGNYVHAQKKAKA